MPHPVMDEGPLSMTIPRAQAEAAAEWVDAAPLRATVQVELRGGTLNVWQGDEGAGFNAAGERVEYRPRQDSDALVSFALTAAELKRRVERCAVTSATEVTLVDGQV